MNENDVEIIFYIFHQDFKQSSEVVRIDINQLEKCYYTLMTKIKPNMHGLSCTIWSEFFNSRFADNGEYIEEGKNYLHNIELEELREKDNIPDGKAPNVLLALSDVNFLPKKLRGKYNNKAPLLIYDKDNDYKDDLSDKAIVSQRWCVNKFLENSENREFILEFLKWIGTDILRLNEDFVVATIKDRITDPKLGQNVIIHGAPGTGKSYWVNHYNDSNSKRFPGLSIKKDNITRVVFHPEYTYFDFVGSYRPCPVYRKTDGSEWVDGSGKQIKNFRGEPHIDYRFIPGPFTKVLVEALKHSADTYTLLIEELNRADAAAVFGEVFQLLDRKGGMSEYPIEPTEEWWSYLEEALEECEERLNEIKENGLRIPSNMNIIATMNSADQGVHLLDTAFKRRWRYKYISVDTAIDKAKQQKDYTDKEIIIDKEKTKWLDFIDAINKKLKSFNIREDCWIGPYFVTEQELKDNGEAAIEKVLFYLWNDVLRNSEMRNKFFADDINSLGNMIDGTSGKKKYQIRSVIKNLNIVASESSDSHNSEKELT